MLKTSQPLDRCYAEVIEKSSKYEETDYSGENILSQTMSEMFENIFDMNRERKISIGLRFQWRLRAIKGFYYNLIFTIRNHFKWYKTISKIRPCEGYDGLIRVMLTHLRDYIETEEKYGHSEKQFRENKIKTTKETVELLERMLYPDEYSNIRRQEVDSRYPDYKGLVTKYKNGGSSYSGRFIPQGDGWAGMEAGDNPRSGYFEFVNGRFQLAESPDRNETDRILTEIENYNEELTNAYKQAEDDSDNDFERLGRLLKENLYSWWD